MEPNAVFSADNEVSKDLAKMREVFGPDDNDLVIVIEGEGNFQLTQLTAIRELANDISKLEGVEHVRSIFDLRRPGTWTPLFPAALPRSFDVVRYQEEVQRHPIARDQLVSADGKLLILWTRFRGDSLAVSQIKSLIGPVELLCDRFEETNAGDVWLCGHPAIRAEVLSTLQRSMVTNTLCALTVAGLVALLLFRGVVVTCVAVLPAALGAAWTMGAMAWMGYPVSGLTTAIPSLVVTIGLTDAVHLMLDANRSLSNKKRAKVAALGMLLRVGPPCLLTSITTAIGFGSLMLSRTTSVRDFGMWAAIGAAIVLLADLFVLPVALQMIPERKLATDESGIGDRLQAWIFFLVHPAIRYPKWTTCFGIAGALVLLPPALSQNPDIIWTETLPRSSDTVQSMLRSDGELGGTMVANAVVDLNDQFQVTDQEAIQLAARIHSAFRATQGFEAPFSIFNVLSTVPGATLERRLQSLRRLPDGDVDGLVNTVSNQFIVSARFPNDGAAALQKRLSALERPLDEVRSEFPGVQIVITGTAVAAAHNMRDVIGDLARSLAFASLLIFGVMTIAFGSFRLGLISLVPNMLPLLITAAALNLLGLPLQITSAVTFSLCLGIAVDDTIHMLNWYKWHTSDLESAADRVRSCVRHVGPPLAITTLVLLAGFTSMFWTPMPAIQLFAALTALTITSAFLGDVIILPAMLIVNQAKSMPQTEEGDNRLR